MVISSCSLILIDALFWKKFIYALQSPEIMAYKNSLTEPNTSVSRAAKRRRLHAPVILLIATTIALIKYYIIFIEFTAKALSEKESWESQSVGVRFSQNDKYTSSVFFESRLRTV